MRIVLAPNAFKGSLTAADAAKCMASGLRESAFSGELILFPVADGGDDTTPLLIRKMNGEMISVSVHDPLGRLVLADYGWVTSGKKALIAMSDASGLRLLKKEERDPLRADTRGTGELIKAALDKGAKKLIIGVGGSATVDGAAGLLHALGMKFLDKSGKDIHDLPIGLLRLHSLDITALDKRLLACEIEVLCDVLNPLLGEQGAAKVFGPQKGADTENIILLEKCMQRWQEVTLATNGFDMGYLPFGGAAGGVAAGLAAFTKARLVSGIEFFLDALHFDEILQGTDRVITAEGSLDEQTLEGKGPYGVACRAKAKNIPVTGLAGQISNASRKKLKPYFDPLIAINPMHESLETAMRNTCGNLRKATFDLGNEWALQEEK